MPPSEAAARRARPPTPRALPTGPEAEVVQAFEVAFIAARGAAYKHGGAKDGAAVKAMLSWTGGSSALVAERIPVFFSDPWRCERASLAMLRSKWNECVPGGFHPSKTAGLDALADRLRMKQTTITVEKL